VKIFWLAPRTLLPPDAGGKIRTLNTIKVLSRRHEITFLCPASEGDDVEGLRQWCRAVIAVPWREAPLRSAAFYAELAVNLFSPLPYIVAKYIRPELIARVRESAGFDVLLCDFLHVSGNFLRAGRLRTKAVLFQHNVESQIRWRQLALERPGFRRWFLRLQCERLERYEREACRRFDHVVAVSEQDAARMRERFGVERVSSVATGVDTAYFQPSAEPPEEDSMVFVGSMDWQSNEDGVIWFVEQALPRVRASRPKARLTVVGRNPSARLRRVCDAAGGVAVTGRVDDVRPHVERAALYVVPLLYGGGTRMKILEALAQGKAVVSTALGSEGLEVADGEQIALADGPEAFAARCVALLGDARRRGAMGAAGRALVESRCGWDAIGARFGEILEGVVKPAV
jgi:glycosyltransferase involved in cell wall biosynthesis